MDTQLLLHEAVERDLHRLKVTKEKLERELRNLPRGSILKRYGKYYHVYRENGKQHMLAIKSENFLNQLKKRKHITKSLPMIKQRIRNCEAFLEKDIVYDPRMNEFELPERYRDVKCPDLWLLGDVDPVEWANEAYQTNPAPMEHPSETKCGRSVRSKSEAIIGSVIEDEKLLYRYEQKIIIFGETFYPDFIILLPNRRRLVYYEHFGKMDDENYVRKTMHKLEMYSRYGLRLGFDFFITFETKGMPFSFSGAKEKIAEILSVDKIA